VDFESTSKATYQLRVSLRGKLSQDYINLRNNDEAAASRWIRKLVTNATDGHPQLLYRMETDTDGEQKFVVGLKSEVGKYGDW